MLSEGQTIGNYRIVRKLGEGGMGAVFEAVHQEIGRKAAIKVLHSQFAQNRQIATRFLNEAKAANLIEHPGVVEIYEFSHLPDGMTFIVMEYLKGDSLAKRLEKGPIGHDTLRIARQIASVLAAAHEKGIVHRDLKPDNVIIVKDPEAPGGERAKVLDFGIAKIAEEQVLKTQAGAILGTPIYMAPEQCKGAAAVTDKSDVYALGVMIYEMLCGKPPFASGGLGEIMVAHMQNEPPPLREQAPGIAPELAKFVHQMLAKDPAVRPTMREVIDDLERLGAARTGALNAVYEQPSQRNSLANEGRKAAAPTDRTIAAEPTPSTNGTGSPPPSGEARPRTMALPDGNPVPPTPTTPPFPAPEGGRGKLVALGTAAAVVIAGLGVGGYLIFRKPGHDHGPTTVSDGGSGPSGPDKPSGKIPGTTKKPPLKKSPVPVPAGMVYVPGSLFQMGSTDEEVAEAMKLCEAKGTACRADLYKREQPAREVTVSDFFLDQTEVTNAQLVAWLNEQKDLKVQKKRFVRDGKQLLVDLYQPASGIEYGGGKTGAYKVRDGYGERPAVLVTWTTAQRYCAAQDKSLPTEAQWELAARGSERRTFPWGDTPPACEGVAFGRSAELPADRRCTGGDGGPEVAGKARDDRTPQHVLGLGGNVAEWVNDRFSDHYVDCGDCKDPEDAVAGESADAGPGSDKADKKDKKAKGKKAPPAEPVVRVIRGGNFNLPVDACRGAGRSRRQEDQAQADVGFRCAKRLP